MTFGNYPCFLALLWILQYFLSTCFALAASREAFVDHYVGDETRSDFKPIDDVEMPSYLFADQIETRPLPGQATCKHAGETCGKYGALCCKPNEYECKGCKDRSKITCQKKSVDFANSEECKHAPAPAPPPGYECIKEGHACSFENQFCCKEDFICKGCKDGSRWGCRHKDEKYEQKKECEGKGCVKEGGDCTNNPRPGVKPIPCCNPTYVCEPCNQHRKTSICRPVRNTDPKEFHRICYGKTREKLHLRDRSS